MLEKIFGKHSIKIRIAIGLVSILVSLTLVAVLIGVFPDEGNVERKSRKMLAETVAAKGSLFITQADWRRLEVVLGVIVERNEDLLSAGIRQNDRLVSEVGDHLTHWQDAADSRSNETQLIVPLWSGDQKWGQVELRFEPIDKPGVWGFFTRPTSLFLYFIAISSFVVFFFYLGKILKHLDPSQAIPDRVRSALDTMAEGLLVMDKDQNLVLANLAFTQLVGREVEDIIGKNVSIFPWDGADNEPLKRQHAPWKKALDSGQVLMNEVVRLTLPSEERLTFMVNCSPVLLPGGKVGGVMVSLDDVTQLEEKELELRRSKEEAEAANRAKSDFLANMSHEIRTPMNAILGFADILRRDKRNLQSDHLKHLNTISSSGQHLLDLINDILDLSKVESGRLEVESVEANPVELIHHVLRIMKVKADEKGLDLAFVAESALPKYILTDPARIRQILTNLIGNAIKFTAQGGVTVHASVADHSPARIEIAVVDTGIGMTEQQASSVFEAFVQADSSISRRFGGTGLGLSISHKFAQALGGDIVVTSQLGEGTTFTLILELETKASTEWLSVDQLHMNIESEDVEEAVEWVFPPARVLVVDDGRENRELIKLVLEGLNFSVTTAENGQEGLEFAKQEAFDAILMDVQMPVMDGYTAVGHMRSFGLESPVVALTAHAMKGVKRECLNAGYSHYMTKPININALVRLLAELLGGREVASQESHSLAQSSDQHQSTSARHERPPVVSTLLAQSSKFEPLVLNFIHRLDQQIVAFKQARADLDYDLLSNLSHWLKGSGGSVGFMEFTEPAAALEEAAKKQDISSVDVHLNVIYDLSDRAKKGVLNEAVEPDIPVEKSRLSINTEDDPNDGWVLEEEPREAIQSDLLMLNEKFRPVVEQFVLKLEDQVSLMQAAIEQDNCSDLADLAHWLKGSGGSVGFNQFTEVATELEQHAKENDLDAAQRALSQVKCLKDRITL